MMLEQFNCESVAVINNAQWEAKKLGAKELCTEHILLAIAINGASFSAKVLASHGVSARRLWRELQKNASRERSENAGMLPLSEQSKQVLDIAREVAKEEKSTVVIPEHLLCAILRIGAKCKAFSLLSKFIFDPLKLWGEPLRKELKPCPKLEEHGVFAPFFERSGYRIIGRAQECNAIIRVLSRRTKNNVVLLGDAGVGKRALIEKLLNALQDPSCPSSIRGRQMAVIDIMHLTMFDDSSFRFIDCLREIERNEMILVLSDFHRMMAPPNNYLISMVGLLAPFLRKGVIRIIALSERIEFERYHRGTKGLVHFFQPLQLKQLSSQEVDLVMENMAQYLQEDYRLTIEPGAVQAAIRGSEAAPWKTQLPGSAVCLLEAACALALSKNQKNVSLQMVQEIVVGWNEFKQILAR